MRLKKIKLAGFKSFVDPTTIEMPTALTGVVGPNGCGKSNVIDAVRWVMGESSAKHLRGDSATDVIFNGSSTRKPVGHATVELVFDNNEGRLGGEYAAYNEIAIKRVLSREGQSIYYLNNSRCRRRDITDIFLGTGLGPRSYAIIQQGTVSRLVEAKPEELRVYLEEVAGIAKYKERRRETENRIKGARENIERISDIIIELEKRLQTLQRQAKAAEKYKELKTEEHQLRAQLLVLRWQRLNAESGAFDSEIKSRETAQEAQIAELRSIEAETEKQREGQVDANEHFNEVQGQFYSQGAEISRIEQQIQHAVEKRQQNSRDLDESERAWTELGIHIEKDQSRIDELQETLAVSEPDREVYAEEAEMSAAMLSECETAMNTWQQEWDEFNSRAATEMQQAEVQRTRITHTEDQLHRLRTRLERLEQERAQLSATELEEDVAELHERLEGLDIAVEEIQLAQENVQTQISQSRENNRELNQQLKVARQQTHELQKRHASLDAVQKAALGKQDGAVKDWLIKNGLQDEQRLAEVLNVDSGWERAVETVLGQTLEAVCVDGFDAIAEQASQLSKGSLTLFDTSIQQVAHSDSGSHSEAQPLSGKVNAPWPIESVLSGIHAVETLSDALAIRESLSVTESVVTKEGIWLGANWMRVVRASDAHSGVLEREHELKKLSAELEASQEQVDQLDEAIHEGETALRSLEEQRETSQKQLNETNHQRSELRANVSRKEARLEEIRTRSQRIEEESEELQEQNEQHLEDLMMSRQQLESLLDTTSQHEEQRVALTGKRDEMRSTLSNAREKARQDRDKAREIVMRIDSVTQQLRSLQESFSRMVQQKSQIEQRREELQQAVGESEEPLLDMKIELEQLLEKRLHLENELSASRTRVESIDHVLRDLNEQRVKIEQTLQTLRSDLDQYRLQWQEVKVRCQTIEEQIEESDYEREELIKDMPGDAAEDEWQQRLDVQMSRIQRLGAINLAAIEEYAEEQERKNYLDSQSSDLNEALDTLESAIRKIDNETRTRFKETFDKVNEKLQEFFPRLFGGGIAKLELTGDNLLDTGVNIIARPPGKRNSSIHQLSGGEKALTAVALVFALFELNPAPFCMLDEVDAPLDDSNTARFCSLVAEMSKRVQFIFITHSKITMELSEQLIGVTMHEPGVSRMVSVDVAEATAMAVA